MDRKKLLTLVSVIGLLACGACFLPPPRPARIHLRGFQNVLVKVTNGPVPGLVDRDELGREIAEAINTKTQGRGPTAHFGEEAAPGEPVLYLYLMRETATSEPVKSGAYEWSLTLTMDATLRASNNVFLGQLPMRQHHWTGTLAAATPELAWRDPVVRKWLNDVANQVSLSLLYGDQASR
jgi:hypothetical protein